MIRVVRHLESRRVNNHVEIKYCVWSTQADSHLHETRQHEINALIYINTNRLQKLVEHILFSLYLICFTYFFPTYLQLLFSHWQVDY